MSLKFSFMVMLLNDSNVLVEAEDRACQEERLRHVVEQAISHVVDVDDLIRHEGDAARDEQHRTGVLRDFETCVFHSIEFFAADDSDCNATLSKRELLRTSFSAAESLVRVCPCSPLLILHHRRSTVGT